MPISTRKWAKKDSMTFVLFFSFLLFLLKPTFFLRFPLFFGGSFTLRFHFFPPGLKRLLRFCADAAVSQLLLNLTLSAFRAVGGLPRFLGDSGAEFQTDVPFENEIQYLVIFRFGSERNFTDGQFSVTDALEHTNPKRILKKHRQLLVDPVHNNPSFNVLWTKNGQPGRGRLLTLFYRTAGLPTGSGAFEKRRVAFLSLSFMYVTGRSAPRSAGKTDTR